MDTFHITVVRGFILERSQMPQFSKRYERKGLRIIPPLKLPPVKGATRNAVCRMRFAYHRKILRIGMQTGWPNLRSGMQTNRPWDFPDVFIAGINAFQFQERY